ncbi:MAG: GNAT family N-acetyltransferase [Rhodobacteraceae bacterium]|nr:GNAT family N-acetyltransferase [Paracoccaceae bacterium]
MSAAAVTIRRATAGDAEELTRLHVRVWRATYAGIAPASAVAALDEAHRLPGWRAALATPEAEGATLVAAAGGAIVGFVRYGPASQAELGPGGEVKYLYVDPDHARQGIGRRLMGAAFAALKAAGFSGATLAVVRENAPALRFYRALGGVQTGRFTDAGPVWQSDNLVLHWPFGGAE